MKWCIKKKIYYRARDAGDSDWTIATNAMVKGTFYGYSNYAQFTVHANGKWRGMWNVILSSLKNLNAECGELQRSLQNSMAQMKFSRTTDELKSNYINEIFGKCCTWRKVANELVHRWNSINRPDGRLCVLPHIDISILLSLALIWFDMKCRNHMHIFLARLHTHIWCCREFCQLIDGSRKHLRMLHINLQQLLFLMLCARVGSIFSPSSMWLLCLCCLFSSGSAFFSLRSQCDKMQM